MEKRQRDRNVKPLINILIILVITIIILILITIITIINNSKDTGDNCLQEDNEEAIFDCLSEKSFEYYDEDNCEKALKVYSDFPVDNLSTDLKARIYDEAYSLSLDCEDTASQQYWGDKYEKLTSNLEGKD